MAGCPKCGRPVDPQARVCPGCGVIMSKVRPRLQPGASAPSTSSGTARPDGPSLRLPPPPRPSRTTPPVPTGQAGIPPMPSGGGGPPSAGRALLKVALATSCGLAALLAIQKMQADPAPPKPPAPPVATAAAPTPRIPQRPALESASGLSSGDVAFLNDLFTRVQQTPPQGPTPDDIRKVEDLFTGHPGEDQLRQFLVALHFQRAGQDLAQRAFPLVEETLAKLKVLEDQPQIYAMEALVRGEQSDWAGVERAVREYEEFGAEPTLVMSVNLAVSLLNQGREDEARLILERPVFASCRAPSTPQDLTACRSAQQMRSMAAAAGEPADPRPRAALEVDASKAQIQSDRFDIRFDGEAQSGVARDVLFVLDRAYVRLKDIYYDQPVRKIPVVLHSSQDYFTKTGAPWWSGGVFSSHNGAIQIPIRGLPRTLPREMEDVLVHELSHAFVDEMSGGVAGRDLQEGLAQYMEGKRIEDELTPAELKGLANTRSQTVMNFYMLSLVVTQQMVQSRGQGVINQLLEAMKETGSEDAAYQKLFGRTRTEMKKEILETFWRRYS